MDVLIGALLLNGLFQLLKLWFDERFVCAFTEDIYLSVVDVYIISINVLFEWVCWVKILNVFIFWVELTSKSRESIGGGASLFTI